jgi:hypothetical protein
VYRPPGLVEYEVAAAQRARLGDFAVLAGVAVKIMSFCHGVSGIEGKCRVYGVYGVAPTHPR